MTPAQVRDSVRRRPGMYIGGTGPDGVLHLVWALVGNAIDQHWAGRCAAIDVSVFDREITVRDDGPGMSEPARYFEEPSNRPTFDGHRPHVHIAPRGVGLFVVNALSERLGVSTIRDGIESRAIYERGELVEPWTSISTTAPSGTTIRFRCDPQIFTAVIPPADALAQRLDMLAHLLPTLDFGRGQTGVGLAGRVARRAGCTVAEIVHAREIVETSTGPVDVELALAFTDAPTSIESFVNLMRTPDGGTHVDGLRAALADRRAIGALSIILADVAFGAPTQDRLVTPAAHDAVRSVASRALK
jgi:DNA gyrase subunit B